MDAMGDADELDADGLAPGPDPLLTAETRAIAGAGLVWPAPRSSSARASRCS